LRPVEPLVVDSKTKEKVDDYPRAWLKSEETTPSPVVPNLKQGTEEKPEIKIEVEMESSCDDSKSEVENVPVPVPISYASVTTKGRKRFFS